MIYHLSHFICKNINQVLGILIITLCPGNDAKLIRCVLGMTLNSSVVVQGMTVKLRPCLPFSGVWMRLCQVESPLQERVWLVC